MNAVLPAGEITRFCSQAPPRVEVPEGLSAVPGAHPADCPLPRRTDEHKQPDQSDLPLSHACEVLHYMSFRNAAIELYVIIQMIFDHLIALASFVFESLAIENADGSTGVPDHAASFETTCR